MAPNAEDWEIVAGPKPVLPWESPDVSAALVWTLRNKPTGETRELVVRVTWKGFDSVDQVPSRLTREAFASAGRPGVLWFMNHSEDWGEIIFHAQTRVGPHGSTGREEIVRLPQYIDRNERLRRELLFDLAFEDYQMLWEPLGDARGWWPDVSEGDRQHIAENVLRELFAEGMIRFFRVPPPYDINAAGMDPAQTLDKTEVDAVLTGDGWRTIPVGHDGSRVQIAPTDAGGAWAQKERHGWWHSESPEGDSPWS